MFVPLPVGVRAHNSTGKGQVKITKFISATEKKYDGYEIQRQVMNVRSSPKEFNFKSTFLQPVS